MVTTYFSFEVKEAPSIPPRYTCAERILRGGGICLGSRCMCTHSGALSQVKYGLKDQQSKMIGQRKLEELLLYELCKPHQKCVTPSPSTRVLSPHISPLLINIFLASLLFIYAKFFLQSKQEPRFCYQPQPLVF